MKITVYTIKDCAFSKQEKEYLNTNKLVFEEKDLETNKDFLTEMLAISNNFAGTPVTRVEKDDGTIAVLKGFTKEEFDKTFGLASPELKAEAGSTVPPPVVETPPTLPVESVSPAPVPTDLPPVEAPVTPDLSADPSSVGLPKEEASAKADPLKSVMDDLQAKAEPFDSAQGKPTPPPVVEQPPASPADLSAVGSPKEEASAKVDSTPPPAGAPTIPDFPTK